MQSDAQKEELAESHGEERELRRAFAELEARLELELEAKLEAEEEARGNAVQELAAATEVLREQLSAAEVAAVAAGKEKLSLGHQLRALGQ